MTLEQKIVLALVKASVCAQAPALPDDHEHADWQAVLEEATQQAVLLMTGDVLPAISGCIPAQIYEQWIQRSFYITAKNCRVNHAQSQLVALLEKSGYAYGILKGEAAASYYPRPELRVLGDVDFLINPADKDAIGQLLADQGFERSHEGHACHQVFRKPNAHLEMHFEVAGIPNTPVGEQLRAFMAGALENCQRRDNGTGAFYAPSHCYHGAVLALHMQHHMLGEGLGLRHLCDWACFVQKTAGESFWEETLLPLFEATGLRRYIQVMTKTCALYLGSDCLEWAQEADEALCEEIMEDILTGGNFGRKDSARAKSTMLISNEKKASMGRGKLYYMYHTLKDSVEEQHPEVKEKAYLYPVYFGYRTARYLLLCLQGERAGLHTLAAKADERKAVYEKLRVFEVKEK